MDWHSQNVFCYFLENRIPVEAVVLLSIILSLKAIFFLLPEVSLAIARVVVCTPDFNPKVPSKCQIVILEGCDSFIAFHCCLHKH